MARQIFASPRKTRTAKGKEEEKVAAAMVEKAVMKMALAKEKVVGLFAGED